MVTSIDQEQNQFRQQAQISTTSSTMMAMPAQVQLQVPTSVSVQQQVQQQTTEDKLREEIQGIFLDLLTAAQKLSYELAVLDIKDEYSKEELKDLLEAAKEVVSNVKKMHRFLEKHARRRSR